GDAAPRPFGAARSGLFAPTSATPNARPQSLSTATNHRNHAMNFNLEDPASWPCFKPLIIAHDVGRSRDRSTAVVGGNSPFQPRVLCITHLEELPQGLYGTARASALASV